MRSGCCRTARSLQTVSDTTGNTATTATQTITVDTVTPSVAISSPGGPTNQATQTITGTVDVADAGATVTILDGTTAVGSAIVQSNGGWSSSVTLNSGSNSLTAKVSELAGNTATSTAVIYTLSTTGPTVTESLAFDTGSSATDHISSNDALSGTGLANTVVHFTIDGSPVATTATANAQGAWSFTPSGLADGPHTIVASQTDTFGNTGTATLSFTLDTTAPVVAITSPGGPTNQATQTITGTVDVADAGATVTILDGTTAVGSAIVQSNGSWSSSVTLNSGSNSLTAKVSDLAGNTATSTAVVYTLSTTGPTVTESLAFDTGSSATDHITSNDALSGTGLANTVVHFTLDGSPVATTVTANAQGAWSFTPSGLADGPHTIVASQTDTFGNTGTATLSFTLDTTAPAEALAITAIAANNGSATTLTVFGTNGALSAGENIQVSSDGGTTWTNVVQNTPTSWSLVDGTSHPSTFTYQARIVDTAGNIGTRTSHALNGESSSGIVFENLNPANGSDITVNVTGPILGTYDGIKALTLGTGNVSVTSAGGNTIAGTSRYGIEAFSNSTGRISVTTAVKDVVTSGRAGINAYNQATSIPQVGGVTTSLISVTANGTINTPNAAVLGNVTVDNFANIIAAGGDGIRAYNYGSGDVTVNDHSNTTIVAKDVFGIIATTYGIGKVSVTTAAGDVIDSGASGVAAVNQATAIPVGAASSVSVTANGTIHSGTHLNPSGSQPQGISAGYFPGGLDRKSVV